MVVIWVIVFCIWGLFVALGLELSHVGLFWSRLLWPFLTPIFTTLTIHWLCTRDWLGRMPDRQQQPLAPHQLHPGRLLLLYWGVVLLVGHLGWPHSHWVTFKWWGMIAAGGVVVPIVVVIVAFAIERRDALSYNVK